MPKFDDGTGGGGRCEASVEGGVDREETVGTMPEPPGGTRGIADRVVRVRGAIEPPSVVVLWGDAGVLACGSGYTPVTVGNGGRHAGASHGAEVVARFEGA